MTPVVTPQSLGRPTCCTKMPRIDEIYAFVAEDAGPDDEGVSAFLMPDGVWMPLIAADQKRVDSLRNLALEIVRASGKRHRLLRFSVREELEVLEPHETH